MTYTTTVAMPDPNPLHGARDGTGVCQAGSLTYCVTVAAPLMGEVLICISLVSIIEHLKKYMFKSLFCRLSLLLGQFHRAVGRLGY